MKQLLIAICVLGLLSTTTTAAIAEGKTGEITTKSAIGAALSLLVWPGIGQAMNDEKDDKVITHALLGLTGVFRFWSCYDALVDRDGGYWKDRI